jgi:hypothetical protein
MNAPQSAGRSCKDSAWKDEDDYEEREAVSEGQLVKN